MVEQTRVYIIFFTRKIEQQIIHSNIWFVANLIFTNVDIIAWSMTIMTKNDFDL